jgi:hypothetical protein
MKSISIKFRFFWVFVIIFSLLEISYPVFSFATESVANNLSNNDIKNNIKISYNNIQKVRSDFRFYDVPLGNSSRDDIVWVYQYGIVSGYSTNSYKPSNLTTRGQMAIFLYNMAGRPDFSPGSNPFRDINASTVGYQEILWLVQNNITTGTTSSTYSPDAKITRNQMALFLHRIGGSPEVDANCGFSDMKTLPQNIKQAVCYLKNTSVTTGTSASTFSPFDKVTRNQMASFVKRAANNILQNALNIFETPDILLAAFFSGDGYNVNLYTSVDGIHFEDPNEVPESSISVNENNNNQKTPQNSEKSEGYKIFSSDQEAKFKDLIEKDKSSESFQTNLTASYKPAFKDPTIALIKYNETYTNYNIVAGTDAGSSSSLSFWVTTSKYLSKSYWSDPYLVKMSIPDGVAKHSDGTVDTWAPEFFMENNNLYVVLSVGNADTYMEQVVAKCNITGVEKTDKLTCSNPQKLNISGATAGKSDTCDLSKNYKGKIDGQIIKYGSDYYLVDKPNGICPLEMFTSKNLMGPYTRINSNITNSNKLNSHDNNGTNLYKTLEGTSSVFFDNKFFGYADNFFTASDGKIDGNMNYFVSGSEKFNLSTIPKKISGPRQMRHGTVINPGKEFYNNLASFRANGDGAYNYPTLRIIHEGKVMPDGRRIQGEYYNIKIYAYKPTDRTTEKSLVRWWDTWGNEKFFEVEPLKQGESRQYNFTIPFDKLGESIEWICNWSLEKNDCLLERTYKEYIKTFFNPPSIQNVSSLGAIWAEKSAAKSIKVTLAPPISDGGWPVLYYKVELTRNKKSTLVKYVDAGENSVTFSNLSSGETYWPKVTAVTGYGTSPAHVRSCGYGSKANCNTGIKI